jgi:hypothetical protein
MYTQQLIGERDLGLGSTLGLDQLATSKLRDQISHVSQEIKRLVEGLRGFLRAGWLAARYRVAIAKSWGRLGGSAQSA